MLPDSHLGVALQDCFAVISAPTRLPRYERIGGTLSLLERKHATYFHIASLTSYRVAGAATDLLAEDRSEAIEEIESPTAIFDQAPGYFLLGGDDCGPYRSDLRQIPASANQLPDCTPCPALDFFFHICLLLHQGTSYGRVVVGAIARTDPEANKRVHSVAPSDAPTDSFDCGNSPVRRCHLWLRT